MGTAEPRPVSSIFYGWYILGASFVILLFSSGARFIIGVMFKPMIAEFGWSRSTVSLAFFIFMLGWLGFASMLGILAAGPASDFIGNKIPIAITFLMRTFLFLLIVKYQNILAFYIFTTVFGFTFLITAPLTPTLIGRLYGISHVGILSGFITTIHHLGGGFWAYIGGVIFDRKGNYELAFIMSIFMAFIAVICSILIKEERHFK